MKVFCIVSLVCFGLFAFVAAQDTAYDLCIACTKDNTKCADVSRIFKATGATYTLLQCRTGCTDANKDEYAKNCALATTTTDSCYPAVATPDEIDFPTTKNVVTFALDTPTPAIDADTFASLASQLSLTDANNFAVKPTDPSVCGLIQEAVGTVEGLASGAIDKFYFYAGDASAAVTKPTCVFVGAAGSEATYSTSWKDFSGVVSGTTECAPFDGNNDDTDPAWSACNDCLTDATKCAAVNNVFSNGVSADWGNWECRTGCNADNKATYGDNCASLADVSACGTPVDDPKTLDFSTSHLSVGLACEAETVTVIDGNSFGKVATALGVTDAAQQALLNPVDVGVCETFLQLAIAKPDLQNGGKAPSGAAFIAGADASTAGKCILIASEATTNDYAEDLSGSAAQAVLTSAVCAAANTSTAGPSSTTSGAVGSCSVVAAAAATIAFAATRY